MSRTSYHLTQHGELAKTSKADGIQSAVDSKQGLIWVDLNAPSEDDIEVLQRVFGFHHLALESCAAEQVHPPKVDDFGEYLFMIVHGINYAAESDILETTELCLFLGDKFVVSSHHAPLFSIDSVMQLVERDGRPMTRGADFLVQILIDALVDNILPAVEKLTDIADDIDEAVVRNPQHSTLEALLKLKQSTLRLNRVVVPQREMINRLSRGDYPLVDQEDRIYYRNVYDHMLHIEGLNQSLRERADIALSTHLSVLANQQNETMKALAIVASIFLPLTLLAGIYGMNFENIPELGVSWGYFAVLGFMAFVFTATVSWFWARRWIGWGRQQAARVRPFVVETEKLATYLGNLAVSTPENTRKAGVRWLGRPFRRNKE